MHDMVHMFNLALQTLYNLPIIQSLKNFMQSLYGYFAKSLKRYLEFNKIAHIMETNGNKILHDMKTC